jgi:L-lysine 6-transaminase
LGTTTRALYEPEYLKKLARAANNKVANPDFLTPECMEYYRLLHELAPQCMRNPRLEVYAVNSGAEAVENMMKYLINLHHHKLLRKGRIPNPRRFIYFDQAFHGRTVFALNVTQVGTTPSSPKTSTASFRATSRYPSPRSTPRCPNRRTARARNAVWRLWKIS